MGNGRPTETREHRRYIEAGYCPAVNPFKTWCNDKAGHVGPHWSTRLLDTDGTTRRETWPDD